MRNTLVWVLVAALILTSALIIVYVTSSRHSDECSKLTNDLKSTMLKIIHALNYSEPYNGCTSGCTSRFYDAYQLLKNNVTVLINELIEMKCSGINSSLLTTYVNYALGNLTEYNSANPLSGIDNALNNTIAAYRLLKGGS